MILKNIPESALWVARFTGLLLMTVFISAWQPDKEKVWRSSAAPLQEIAALRKQIKAPQFPDKDFIITAYGAKADGATMNTAAFKAAIEACSRAGGGRVVVPPGKYLTGPIYLKSNVNLHVQENATIVFSRNTKDYPLVLTRWEGMDCMNFSPQFYAYKETNIALTGRGTIDGNADNNNWWPWKGQAGHGWTKGAPSQFADRDTLHYMMHNKVDARQRIFGEGHYLRPYMFQPYDCRNILVSGLSMISSPMWFISPVMCNNVIIEKLHIQSHGPNTDGCDPDACKNVLIRDCFFDTGDDCIAIKSGRDEDGRRFGRPAENHLIENCEMKDGHGGVVIGSEIAGGARNIYAINCNMSSPELDKVLRIKTSSSRGGIIENIFMQHIKVGTFKDAAIHCTMFYEKPGEHIPTIRNIWVEDLSVTTGGEFGVFINAYNNSPVRNLTLVNCNINGIKTPLKIDHATGVLFNNVMINGKQVTVSATFPDK